MANLSHWDFAIDFNGFEASALILGIDPQAGSEGLERVKPVFERVARSYAALRTWHEIDITPGDTGTLTRVLTADANGLHQVFGVVRKALQPQSKGYRTYKTSRPTISSIKNGGQPSFKYDSALNRFRPN